MKLYKYSDACGEVPFEPEIGLVFQNCKVDKFFLTKLDCSAMIV